MTISFGACVDSSIPNVIINLTNERFYDQLVEFNNSHLSSLT